MLLFFTPVGVTTLRVHYASPAPLLVQHGCNVSKNALGGGGGRLKLSVKAWTLKYIEKDVPSVADEIHNPTIKKMRFAV